MIKVLQWVFFIQLLLSAVFAQDCTVNQLFNRNEFCSDSFTQSGISKFKISASSDSSSFKNSRKSVEYPEQSLLASGDWYKIKVKSTGVYSLSYEQLKQIGLSEPEKVRVYSYGGRQLSYENNSEFYNDMVEIPIKMNSGADGVFSSGDYILFYAEGTQVWNYSKGYFLSQTHAYSKYIYLFITDSRDGVGLRVENVLEDTGSIEYETSSYNGHYAYDENELNLIKSGRTWYGKKFIPGADQVFNFSFERIDNTEPIQVYTRIAGKKSSAGELCYFSISADGNALGKIYINKVPSKYEYAIGYSGYFKIDNPEQNIGVKFLFEGQNMDMEGYIDYVCLNTREKLIVSGEQFNFRDVRAIGKTTKYNISSQGEIFVWDVSNPINPKEVVLDGSNGVFSFSSRSDTVQEFVVCSSEFKTPIIEGDDLGKIENQNLHGVHGYDMIILTNHLFREQAEELAQIHRDNDGLKVFVTEPQYIYNEFSSGTPDISAIRNFLRMLYDKAMTDEEKPKYLLLFGDGSYDNISDDVSNSNFLPTYQSVNSLQETSSYVSDDFYGLLDEGEGEIGSGSSAEIYGYLDLGIGRFPVRTETEADLMIDKVKQYISENSFGNWKNRMCFIGDDDDNAIHMYQANYLSDMLREQHSEYNSVKILFDAYKQISTPSGQKYPDVTKAINHTVENGVLVVDYVGHGNPRKLAHETVLTINDVQSWTNWDRMPVFITASCEVGRYDDYEDVSLGEWFLLSPKGGGIAAITTTRVVYSGENFDLSKNLFDIIANKDYAMGDLIRLAKNEMNPGSINHRNFTLLGDPALKISIPENKIIVGSVNGNLVSLNNSINESIYYESGDTLKALSRARIQGYVEDAKGNLLNDDGVLYINIYDKPDTLQTYGQDNNPFTFSVQDKILYSGKASISEGYFDFEFVVPKDINYKYGKGKISMYAILDSSDAAGYSESVVIGGSSDIVDIDDDGPDIGLYMNDTTFENGGITNENPVLLALLKDEFGINTTGNGFGHNITAILDGDQDNVLILNNYYEGGLDKYNQGELRYPLYGLSVGYHYLTLKVWDVYNNSSEEEIEFYVHKGGEPVISGLRNYPNPMRDETSFVFSHNLALETINVRIDIYDIMGNRVAIIERESNYEGFNAEPIVWNGIGVNGNKLDNGVYTYRLQITTANGEKTYQSSKLVIFR